MLLFACMLVPPGLSAVVVPSDGGALEGVGPAEVHGIIVRFDQAVPSVLVGQGLDGVTVHHVFETVPAAYVTATRDGLASLAGLAGLVSMEDAWTPIEFQLESATVSSRVRELWDPSYEPPAFIDEPSPALTDTNGHIIDGTGVGIALVDSGVDATHPDLSAPGKLAGSYIVTPTGVHAAGAYTEQGTTHGTHMAGIAAGTGAASQGERRGAAPGASLYAFATWAPEIPRMTSPTVLAPAMAFDWILAHGASQDPPIQVVLAPWSCAPGLCSELDGSNLHLDLAEDLAEQGFVVVFPVGNEGGKAGVEDRLSAEAKLDTPGILGVANHDDQETGGRSDCIKSASSRGHATDPATWPDIAAPGDEVWSPQAIAPDPETRVPEARRTYTQVTGTSASAAHTAGLVALLLQANPMLEPEEVEYVLEATAHQTGTDCLAYPRADPTHPWTGANFAAGHGLIDAMDAVQLALGFTGIPDHVDTEPIPASFSQRLISVDDPGLTLYLQDDHGLSREAGDDPASVKIGLDQTMHTFLSEPLADGLTTSGIRGDIWMGTTGEVVTNLVPPQAVLQVYRVPVDGGEVELVMEDDQHLIKWVATMGPVNRRFVVPLDGPVSFEQGDRVRVDVGMRVDGFYAFLSPVIGNHALYLGGSPTPSRVQLGTATPVTERLSPAGCIVDPACAPIGGELTHNTVWCEDGFPRYHVAWTGPPGSSAWVECNGALASCTVPLDLVAAEGKCVAETPNGGFATEGGDCGYVLPDGGKGGSGYCASGQAP